MDHLLFQQTAFYQRELSLFKTRRDWMSEWRWYHDGGNNRRLGKWKGELSRAAEWWTTEDLRRQEAKVICRETGRENRLFPKPLFHLFVSLGESQGDPRMPIQRRGKQPGRFEGGGWTSKGFGSKTRWGELWPLSGSPWWLLLCLLSHQTFVAHFSLSFSARGLFCPADMATDSQTPQKNILTDRTSVVVDVRSDSCWRFKPQIGFTTDHSSKLITPSKGAICKSSLVAVKSQTFRPFPCVYHPVSQCWIVKNERRPQQKARMQTSRHCAVHIKLTLGYPGVTVVKLCRLTQFASGERTDSVSRVFMSSTPGSHCCVYERVCLCVSRVINMCDGSNCMLPIFTKVKTGSLQWLLFGNANDYWVSSGSGIESHHFLTKMWRLQQVTKTCPDS